ncbi:MAG: hypothetical protein ACYS76_06065 [Planctomycetota bacterium]
MKSIAIKLVSSFLSLKLLVLLLLLEGLSQGAESQAASEIERTEQLISSAWKMKEKFGTTRIGRRTILCRRWRG